MIVEPVPTSSPSPVRRALRLAAMALPLAMLGGVITVGALGPRPAPPAAADAASADPAAPGATLQVPAPDPWLLSYVITFPAEVGGLPVRTVAATLEAHRERSLDSFAAVSGFLTIQDQPPECADRYLGPYGALCERRTLLTDSPRPRSSSSGSGSGPGGIGPHLHPLVPVGVQLPHQVVQASMGDTGSPVRVVVLGRFVDDARQGCTTGGRHCGEGFVVERVAWADGADYPRTTTIDPTLEVYWIDRDWQQRRDAARAALGYSRTLLMTAYVRPATLARIDPAAATAIRAVDGDATAVWYVRGLERGYDPTAYPLGAAPPRVVWAVVDDLSGGVVARGTEAAGPPGTAMASTE